MSPTISRRGFLVGVSAAGAAAWLPHRLAAAPGDIKFGYAAITWDGNDLQAIEDVSSVGFKGIQLRAPVVKEYGVRPAALRELLARHRLTFVALSSGNARSDPAEKEEVEKHTRHAKFVRDVGGLYLQLIDERPKGRPIVPADYKRLGQMLTEVGKRTADLGIPLGYHHHMNSLGERPEEVDAILEAADSRYVKLVLDVAHYQMGGGDPVTAVRKYAERLLFMHIKDLETPVPGATGDVSRSYRFVELGRGQVNLPAVFAALDDVRFRGWAIVELDRVPDNARTPKESAIMSREYLQRTLHFTI